jgi:hypothetical protein
MSFEEWWKSYVKPASIYTLEKTAEDAYEAGIQEGIDRMYRLYDICPECGVAGGQHKMDCSRG